MWNLPLILHIYILSCITYFSMVYLRSSKTDSITIPSTKHSLINGIKILCFISVYFILHVCYHITVKLSVNKSIVSLWYTTLNWDACFLTFNYTKYWQRQSNVFYVAKLFEVLVYYFGPHIKGFTLYHIITYI